MRIVVISDSHKNYRIVEKIIKEQSNAKHIFFLGDNVADIEDFAFEYTDRTFHIVSGNCDFFSTYPVCDLAKIGDTSILFSHGHTFGVKGSTSHILSAATARNCKIALFGHTHIPHISYENGVYIVNPGSCSVSRQGPNTYAVIDIEKNGIMPIIMEAKF